MTIRYRNKEDEIKALEDFNQHIKNQKINKLVQHINSHLKELKELIGNNNARKRQENSYKDLGSREEEMEGIF